VIYGTFAVVSNSVRKYTFWIVIIMRPGLFGFLIYIYYAIGSGLLNPTLPIDLCSAPILSA
jgi:hypothetical protein